MATAEEEALLLEKVVLLDEDEEPVSSRQVIGEISAERRDVWSSRIDLSSSPKVVAVQCTGGRGLLEHAVCIRRDLGAATAIPLLLECKVSCEPLPPAHLVEYKFDSDTDDTLTTWRLSMVCLDYLLAFRAGKFADWEKRMLQPTCKAEFRRMFAIGPVYTVYDHYMFPSSEQEQSRFQVTDDHGKTVILPRPVAALRIWSVEKQAYEEVDPTLDGAPVDREAYWKELVERLRKSFPEEVAEMESSSSSA